MRSQKLVKKLLMGKWTNTLHVPNSHKNELRRRGKSVEGSATEPTPTTRTRLPQTVNREKDVWLWNNNIFRNTPENFHLLAHKFYKILLIKI